MGDRKRKTEQTARQDGDNPKASGDVDSGVTEFKKPKNSFDDSELNDVSDLAHLSKKIKPTALSKSSTFDYGNMEPHRIDPRKRVIDKSTSTCTKIKDHNKFIPFTNFTSECLPVEYRGTNLFESVKALGFLTLRVRCSYTSTKRPKVHQASGSEYPFYQDRGRKDIFRTGTGRVWHVMLRNDGEPCSCYRCEGTKTRQGKITILTATHVVFDASEARATHVDFFLDDESRKSTITLKADEVYVADAVSDRCYFDCYTCDVELLQNLFNTWKHWLTLCKTVRDEHQMSEDTKNKLAIIVAHPHGQPKQVSVGRWFETHDSVDSVHFYTYDCPTCPGSSGAFVLTLARQGWWSNHVHSGANLSVNYSSSGIDWGWCEVSGSKTES